MNPPESDLASYPLLSALRDRRSRRFGCGMVIPPGPLQFASRQPPTPITESAEALLAWAACGVTGPALADLAYGPGQGGSIMAGLVGRTVASGDCLQTVGLVVMNDHGTWWMRRPQDLPRAEITELIENGRRGEYLDAYRRTRVRLADRRLHPPVEPIFNINANRWSAEDGVSVATSGGLSDDWTNRKYKPESLWAYQPLRKFDDVLLAPRIATQRNPIDIFLEQRLPTLQR